MKVFGQEEPIRRSTNLRAGITTFLLMFAKDERSFLYALPSHGETTVWRQPWRNGGIVGDPVAALKLPFALREDYFGNAFAIAPDLSSVVFARPGDMRICIYYRGKEIRNSRTGFCVVGRKNNQCSSDNLYRRHCGTAAQTKSASTEITTKGIA